MKSFFNIFKVITLLLITCGSINTGYCSDGYRILTTSSPIASLIKLLLPQEIELNTLSQAGECPHHYSLKPSDFKKTQAADLIIYIDDNFETFIHKLPNTAKRLKLTDIKTVALFCKQDMHFWINPNITLKILPALAEKLQTILPKRYYEEIGTKLASSRSLLIQAAHNFTAQRQRLCDTQDIYLLSNSLHHLFSDDLAEVCKVRMLNLTTPLAPTTLTKLEKAIDSKNTGIFTNLDQSGYLSNIFQKHEKEIIVIDVEDNGKILSYISYINRISHSMAEYNSK